MNKHSVTEAFLDINSSIRIQRSVLSNRVISAKQWLKVDGKEEIQKALYLERAFYMK